MKRRTVVLGVALTAVVGGAATWTIVRAVGSSDAPPASARPGLEAVLDLGTGPADDLARQRRHDEVERHIEQCMRSSGFAYEPVPYVPPRSTGDIEVPADVTTARDRGYGISTALSPTESEPDRVDEPASTAPRSLGDAERAAWLERLGNPLQPGTCRALAEDAADERLAGVTDDLATLTASFERAVEASPVLRRLDRRWKQCMRAAGHEVDRPADVIEVIDTALTEARVATGADGVRTFDAARLRSVQELERSLAEAAVRCRVPLAHDYDEAMAAIGTGLRAQHAAEVDRVRSALGRGG
ncbi:MAG TPA: hypothetical protein VNQ33_09085 [Acidimicrobiales bacterium]|nr:hypothetical protein [Acidimicrobiales bacterium]